MCTYLFCGHTCWHFSSLNYHLTQTSGAPQHHRQTALSTCPQRGDIKRREPISANQARRKQVRERKRRRKRPATTVFIAYTIKVLLISLIRHPANNQWGVLYIWELTLKLVPNNSNSALKWNVLLHSFKCIHVKSKILVKSCNSNTFSCRERVTSRPSFINVADSITETWARRRAFGLEAARTATSVLLRLLGCQDTYSTSTRHTCKTIWAAHAHAQEDCASALMRGDPDTLARSSAAPSFPVSHGWSRSTNNTHTQARVKWANPPSVLPNL